MGFTLINFILLALSPARFCMRLQNTPNLSFHVVISTYPVIALCLEIQCSIKVTEVAGIHAVGFANVHSKED